jgi:preprotein translocase subunit YajC
MGTAAILAATSTSKGNPYLFPIIIVALFGLLYFVMIRPQRNRQRQAQQMQSTIVPGQRVRTTAGMYATVTSIDGDDVVLEIAPGVNVKYMRRAIMGVAPDETGDTMNSDGQVGDTGDTIHSDGQVDGSGPATGQTGTPADAEDGPATS